MTLNERIDSALDRLNPRQRRFILAFSVSGNLTRSYLEAGFKSATADSAESNARRLIQRPDVANALALLQQREAEKYAVTRDFLVEHVRKVLQTNPEAPPTHRDHIRAVEVLAKMFGLDTPQGKAGERLDIDFSLLTTEELATYERLTRKACGLSLPEPPATQIPDRLHESNESTV